MEIWKDITGYEGLYMISNLGNVKSLVGFNGKEYYNRDLILRQTLTTTGYYKVELYKQKKRKSLKVHRLVAIHFIDNYLCKEVVNHLDGDKLNNKVENLEWCTTRENVIHAIETGLTPRAHISKEELGKLYTDKNMTLREISEKTKVGPIRLAKLLNDYGIKRRKPGYKLNKYNIDLDILLSELKDSKTDKELSEKYKCPSNLIARRKYQFKKKGEL